MNLDKLTPDQVCGWIQKQIRALYGDRVENKSHVWASHGYYYVLIFRGRRKGAVKYEEHTLRRKNLSKLFKGLKRK